MTDICITPEGWDDIYNTLHSEQFTEEQLRAALADDDYEAWEQDEIGDTYPNYDLLKARYAILAHDTLADLAYERVERNNTCDNGGCVYWIDRKGYHTVKLS